jgi:hypothetical protein
MTFERLSISQTSEWCIDDFKTEIATESVKRREQKRAKWEKGEV